MAPFMMVLGALGGMQPDMPAFFEAVLHTLLGGHMQQNPMLERLWVVFTIYGLLLSTATVISLRMANGRGAAHAPEWLIEMPFTMYGIGLALFGDAHARWAAAAPNEAVAVQV